MVDFMSRKYDVLVCTTIIESGLDIPNANTLIIDHSHRFGLAELYQLRGRVGRASSRAYAYLLYHSREVTTSEAVKRLSAIQEFTQLGSGYQLAMRDLEIRGTGNMLGAEQHGHMLAVGFDLYCSLVEEAVREIKGDTKVPARQIIVDLQVDAYVPDDYIEDERQRIAIYRRMGTIENISELKEIKQELIDRFGAIPAPVGRLIELVALKLEAQKKGIDSINRQKDIITLRFCENTRLKGMAGSLKSYFPDETISPRKDRILINVKSIKAEDWLEGLMKSLGVKAV
jgi:transcription-repair coupling factor (superfamily II helicase)